MQQACEWVQQACEWVQRHALLCPAQATVKLTKVFDWDNVVNVTGGTMAWREAGYEVQRPTGGCGCGSTSPCA